jgi:hypothetical protein
MITDDCGRRREPDIFEIYTGRVFCKCGHWIGIVGAKWEHIRRFPKIESQERCYRCECTSPKPVVNYF